MATPSRGQYHPFNPAPLPRPPMIGCPCAHHLASAPQPYTAFPPVPPPPLPPANYPHYAYEPYRTSNMTPCDARSPAHTVTPRYAAVQELPGEHRYPVPPPVPARPNNVQVREWMRSLGREMSGMQLGGAQPSHNPHSSSESREKPLPQLPPSSTDQVSGGRRAHDLHGSNVSSQRPPSPSLTRPSLLPVALARPSVPLVVARPPATSVLPPPRTQVSVPPSSRQRHSFQPSFHPFRPRPSHAALLSPPVLCASQSDTALAQKTRPPRVPVIDLTSDSTDNESEAACSSDSGPVNVTPRSPARRRRARASAPATAAPAAARARASSSSQIDQTPKARRPSPSPRANRAPPSPSPTPGSPSAVRCAGFTRTGQPCKRLVKAAAPYLAHRASESSADGDGDDEHPRVVGRYCQDHAGLVCHADGFYWRGADGTSSVWVAFSNYVPAELGQQTQTLLRMTMESPLTSKELPGFLYAYELRDLGNSRISYFKVGRTDNVPRRIGQWTKQCTSHTPTLRDIFPGRPARSSPFPASTSSTLQRHPSLPRSLLPGAVSGGTSHADAARMAPAVKRWERLVHLELADRAARADAEAVGRLLAPCADCGATHKEIFPLATAGGYEVVVEIVSRWERFIRAICATT